MRSDTAAFLVANSLGKAATLGDSLFELASGGVLWGRNERDLYRAAQETARELKRTAGQLAHSPELSQTILDLLNDANFSLIEVLRVAGGANPMTVAHAFPVALLSADVDPRPVEPEPQFADAHMHSGATLSLEALLELGLSAEAEFPRDLREVLAYDRFGQQFSLGAVYVAVVRVLQYTIAERDGKRSRISPRIRAAILGNTFWREVRFLACGTTTGHEELATIKWEDLASRSPGLSHSPADVAVEIRTLVNELFSHRENSHVALGFVQALLLINEFLRSDHGEGLSAFVARFARVSAFRKVASGPLRERVLATAARDVFSGGVQAAEFRKTIDSDARRSLQVEVLKELSDHLVAFDASGAFAVHPRGASMPVSFRRRGRLIASHDLLSVAILHPIDRHLALGNTVADIIDRWPHLAVLIGAVDIVGNELDEPNWAFIPMLHELRSRVGDKLIRTCHAGEHFAWPLQGIRSVGELLRPSRVVDRIGHALALDPTCADFITGAAKPVYDARSVLDDICWLAAVGKATDEVLTFASQVLGWLGMHERGLELADFVAAWQGRRTVAGLSELLGFGADMPFAPAAEIQYSYASHLSGPALALALMLYRGGAPGFAGLDRPLPPLLAEEYRRINETLSPGMADTVLKWIIEDGVIIEACPTSNLTLAGLPRPKYLPIARWLSLGATVTVSSDDPTHFSTRVANEIDVLRPVLGPELLEVVVQNSLHNCHPTDRRYGAEDMRRLASAAAANAWDLVVT